MFWTIKLATNVLLNNNEKSQVNKLFAALDCMVLLTLDLMKGYLFSNRDVSHISWQYYGFKQWRFT